MTEKIYKWHGLPAMKDVDEKGNQYHVFFTNMDNEMIIGRLPYEEKDCEEKFLELKNKGVFDCLNRKDEINKTFSLTLSLTERCNLKCRYCFLEANESGISMSVDLLHTSIDKAFEFAGDRKMLISAFGGEPGIRYELLKEMVSYTKTHIKYKNDKVTFGITTNGFLSKKVVDLLIKENFSVSVSMDGIKEVQNYHRPTCKGEETFDLVVENIKKLVSNNCLNRIRSTVTAYSVDKMVDAVKFFASLGVKKVVFQPVTNGGRGNTDIANLQAPTMQEFSHNLMLSIKEAKNIGIDVSSFSYMNLNTAPRKFCSGNLHNKLVVGPSGFLSSCVEVQDDNHPLSKVLGFGTINEINKCDNHDKSIFNTASKCKDCGLSFYCGDGCPTRNYRSSNSTNTIDDSRCQVNQAILPQILRLFYESTCVDK